jgi:hypothetical protein
LGRETRSIIDNVLLRGFWFGLILLFSFLVLAHTQPFLLCAVGLGCCETSKHNSVDNLGIIGLFNLCVCPSTYIHTSPCPRVAPESRHGVVVTPSHRLVIFPFSILF